MIDIDNIINEYFQTDRGYLYLVDLIKNKFPSLKINEENLNDLKITIMEKEEFLKTGFVGIYNALNNSISVFTNRNEQGEMIYELNLDNEYIINTFLHELIHALTTTINEDNSVIEGINIRLENGTNSFFLALNEGITQMITDDIMGHESDAYPFETNFARQIAFILGKDKLLEIYSSNNPNLLLSAIDDLNSVDAFSLIQKMFYFHLVTKGIMLDNNYNLGTIIQSDLIKLYRASKLTADEEYAMLLLDIDKVKEYLEYIPACNLDADSLGFRGINDLKKGF